MVIPRILEDKLRRSAKKYPVIALMGPRQSGKTTLAKAAFPKKPYATLENPDSKAFALSDPKRFLAQFPKGAILDEVQGVPEIFSYIQGLVDETGGNGRFILTGSQNFQLMEKITQSLAGRVSVNRLLSLSLDELDSSGQRPKSLERLLLMGGYPRIHAQKINSSEWFADYAATYVERDVRLIKNIGNLTVFSRFLRMVAARSGQVLNLSSLANDCGVTHNTAKAWLSILEASFLVFLLPPYFKNFNKRLSKSPKLYFLDAGLLCYFLGVSRPAELMTHSMRGAIFETFVISELVKSRFNRGLPLNLYYWREKNGHEIDCLMDQGQKLIPIEIKSGETINPDYFTGIRYWRRLTGSASSRAYVIYAGSQEQDRDWAKVVPWFKIGSIDLAP